MPHLLEDRSILQNVSITNHEHATKYKLRKEKIHVHPNIEHVLFWGQNNENALTLTTISYGKLARYYSIGLWKKHINQINWSY